MTTKDATEELFLIASTAPFNIAPERAAELVRDVFGPNGINLQSSKTSANFYARVEERACYASFAGFASLWCLSFVCFHVIDLGTRAASDPTLTGSPLDIGPMWHKQRLSSYVDFSCLLMRNDAPWPSDLQKPVHDAPLDCVNGRINNLFFGALSWIFLHEIGHIHLVHEHLTIPGIRNRQEFSADDFATKWILESCPNDQQREFRVLAISLAQMWLLLQEKTVRQGTLHPPAYQRFRETIEHFGVSEDSLALECAGYMMQVLFQEETADMPHDMTAADAFHWCHEQIKQKFDN